MTLQNIKELGNALLGSLISLNVPAYPEEEIPCPCGQTATYQRMRPAHVDTLLGTITLNRPYYLCRGCHHGLAPLDQQLGLCAGGISAGLEELLALVGAQLPFEEAVELVAKLTLVEVCPNTCKGPVRQRRRRAGASHRSKGARSGRSRLGCALFSASSTSGEDSRAPLCLYRWHDRPYP
jgi:hypothetical protein